MNETRKLRFAHTDTGIADAYCASEITCTTALRTCRGQPLGTGIVNLFWGMVVSKIPRQAALSTHHNTNQINKFHLRDNLRRFGGPAPYPAWPNQFNLTPIHCIVRNCCPILARSALSRLEIGGAMLVRAWKATVWRR